MFTPPRYSAFTPTKTLETLSLPKRKQQELLKEPYLPKSKPSEPSHSQNDDYCV